MVEGCNWKKRSKETSNDLLENTVFGQNGSYLSTGYNWTRRVSNSRLDGWDIPNFHQRKRRGELIPQTPFKVFSQEGETEGDYDIYWSTNHQYIISGTYSYYTSWICTESDIISYVPQTTLKYVQAAAAKLYGNGHDTLTFLAELASVRRMFVNVARRLSNMNLPRSFMMSPAKRIRQSMNDWLEYRYGWRTLLMDLRDLSQALASMSETRTRFSESVTDKHTTSTTNEFSLYISGFGYRDFVIVDELEISLRGNVVADVKIPSFQFNPFATAWELVPYSFVVDWLIGIGKSIATMSFMMLHPDYTASAGWEVKLTRAMSMTWRPITGYSGTHYQNGTCVASLRQRTPCNIPLLPQFNLNIDRRKVLDLIAMTVQKLPRR